MISYVFNGLVFVLLGLQLRHMLAAVGHYDAAWLAGLAFGVWALLAALRLSWVWLSAHVRFRLQWAGRARAALTAGACFSSAGLQCAVRSRWPPRSRCPC
ncbi:MAG: hypothetical protein IPJ42_16160 [Betaproteobacteria bacterium]|nr:hypothetical protein [Betaproteobacteria bacterium]